ncbi:uncharacterized protein LOC133884457 isoform X2 [Phragmites australis]|uniref:uncharacterized protein LOC133884457 isoform X2 n=1 Tax=Phragmites australis TaxID=29695 RepID=UPI002D76F3B8|nr:uncharacterized protein LOC133884457 isoform X2 [Phragmites australis]
MSSEAVAASDPGGGKPKLVAGADVAMAEAAEEVVPAPTAEVKVEGKVRVVESDEAAAMDVEQEGGEVTAVSDSLYATESAGMVTEEGRGDEPLEGADGVNGGAGGQETVQAGAGGLQNEAERKPVPVEDVVAPAAAGQAVKAAGSATLEHAEADPGRENKERDNGVAHCDTEIQNNVPGDVEGSSKIHEDVGAPAVDQPDDRSEMLLQTGEQVPGSGNNPSGNEVASPGNVDQCARYCLPLLDKGGFRVSDLVWGKVKSHPWWPGEIFYQSDASELALKHQKKGSHLVAYFGDNTFAWCDESQLKPFVTNYSQMEKQSSSDAFVGSVNNALEELSRRILSGMSCSCLPEELSDSGMSYTVENAGLKDGVTCSAVNRSEILKCFSPENLLHYIKELALFPGQGGDLLELVIACSQLTSFYRSKGCSELASFQTGSAWVEDGMDTPSTHNVMVEEAVINEVHPTHDKPKRGRGRPRKQKPEDYQAVMEKKGTSNQANDTTCDEKQMVMDFDDFDNLQKKKKRSFDSFEDSENSTTPTGGISFKIGECIRRAASQLTGSSSIVKAQTEPTVYKNTAEAENGEFDISSDDAVDELTVLNRAKRRRMHRNHTADPQELLSQLCLVATEPMNSYNFLAMIISYYSDYRNYVVSTTTEASVVEKTASKRGRKRKVLPSPEVETTDHMQDSYWSGLSLHNHPIHNLRKESSTTRPRRRRRSSQETYVPLQELGASGPKKQIQVIERSIIHVDEKMVDEFKPTALVLSFGRSAAVPSVMDLIKMFSRYGPLKETETEVQKDTNTVKVVFKKRTDAERAFSVAGKYGTFGPSLRSYRLVNMPFSLGKSEVNNPEKHTEDCGPEVYGLSESKVSLDAMQIDRVDQTEKLEVVGEPSVEQVAAKQTSQVEASDKTSVNQADDVEKTEHIDAELTGHAEQFGSGAQAESVAEGSSEQVSTVEQAFTQKEASVEGLLEITQSVAATGASNEGMIEQTVQVEAVTEASGGQIEVGKQTPQAESMTDATTGHSIMVKETVESNVELSVEENMENNAAAVGLVEETAEGETIAEASDEKIENKAGETREGEIEIEIEVEALDEKKENKAVAESITGDTAEGGSAAEAPLEETRTAEGTADDVEALDEKTVDDVEAQDEKTTAAEKTVDDATVEIPDEKPTTGEKTVDDAMVEIPDEKTVEDVTVEALDEKARAPEKTIEETTVEAPDEKPTTAEKTVEDVMVGKPDETTVEDSTVETPDEKARAPEKTIDDTMVDAPDEKPTTTEKSVEDAMVEKPDETTVEDVTVETTDEKARAPEKTIEETTVEAPDEKPTTAEKTVEDAMVEKPDETTVEDSMVEKPDETTVEDSTVETPDEKARAPEKTIDDTTVDAPDEKPTTTKESVEDAMVEKPDETTVEDSTVETPDEKARAPEKTIEETTVEAPDGKPTTAEKIVEDAMVGKPDETTVEDSTIETPDEKARAPEKTIDDTTVDPPDEKPTTTEKSVEDAMVEKPDETTVEDSTVEIPDEKARAPEKTIEETTVEAPDEKPTTAEKTVEDSTVERPDEKARASEKTIEETTVGAPDVQADK